MAKRTWMKGLIGLAGVGALVAGGLYLYGSSSGNTPPATVDFAALDNFHIQILFGDKIDAFQRVIVSPFLQQLVLQ